MKKTVVVKKVSIGEGIPKICVPIVGTKREEIYKMASLAVCAQPDLVEWRADFYENIDKEKELQETLEGLKERLGQIPLLFTVRTAGEGGALTVSEEDYARINQKAAESGLTDLVDVEFFMNPKKMKELIKKLQLQGSHVIASSHDFEKTGSQEELIEGLQGLQYSGADIIKMAVMPHNTLDVIRLLQVTRQFSKSSDLPVITMAMGEIGAMSRMSGQIFGSCVTFGTAGSSSAPGQIPVEELRGVLEVINEELKR